MINARHPPPEEDKELRELHILYWAIAERGDSALPRRTYEEFCEWFQSMQASAQRQHAAEFHKQYEQLLNAAVPEGMKVIDIDSSP